MNRSMGVAAMLALAGCGGVDSSGNGNGTTAATAKAVTAATAGWNAEDACSVLDRDAVAKALGVGVTTTELGSVSPAAEGRAASSMCTYTLADGSRMALLARAAPNGDSAGSDVEASRTAGGTLPPAADVPGLGRTALWRDRGAQLQLFLDDRRYVAIDLFGPVAATDAKAKAIAVAKLLR